MNLEEFRRPQAQDYQQALENKQTKVINYLDVNMDVSKKDFYQATTMRDFSPSKP